MDLSQWAPQRVWSYIQSLPADRFAPFRDLTKDSAFTDVKSGLQDPEQISALRQKLQRLGVFMPSDGETDEYCVTMAISAIDYRMSERFGA